MIGVEPVQELREQGHANGLTADELRDGDALHLNFPDNSFDVVCAFAVLHHIKDHRRAVAEMCRVARHAVFISDANNFGQGGFLKRTVKQAINGLGLFWALYDQLATRRKGYHWSEGDGVYYSYTVFKDLPVLKRKFPKVHLMSTGPASVNLFRTAPHLAVFAVKE